MSTSTKLLTKTLLPRIALERELFVQVQYEDKLEQLELRNVNM